jgi:hypothetical protein
VNSDKITLSDEDCRNRICPQVPYHVFDSDVAITSCSETHARMAFKTVWFGLSATQVCNCVLYVDLKNPKPDDPYCDFKQLYSRMSARLNGAHDQDWAVTDVDLRYEGPEPGP